MPIFLKERQPELVEMMDRSDCDPILLKNTYQQFSTINLLLSKWKKIYQEELRPLMQHDESYRVLDIGFGGGDISIRLAKWASEDGYDVQFIGIETDERALEFVTGLDLPDSVQFQHCSTTELMKRGETFDFVISNHLMHHLDQEELLTLLREAKSLANRKIVFNDIERSDLGYTLFWTLARYLFRRSFIVFDGLRSIKRSFTKQELINAVPDTWTVKRIFPFRLLLTYEPAH